MRKSLLLLTLIITFTISNSHAQNITQTVRGKVVDLQTKQPLVGANVVIIGTQLGAATSSKGEFRIAKVPVGRYTIKIMYIGYKSRVISELLIGSAKEIVLTIELKEDVIIGQEIVVTPKIEKSQALNSMSTVSARSFSVEETGRYAGGLDDPARVVSSFAGVSTGYVQDNSIVIRGNAPKGLLWRLEGVVLFTPNHFSDISVIGGGFVTIFSNQLLDNSDFFTGAFPAEYGNALSGVFDMKLRNGNNEVRESTFQAGIMGIDFATEGPFKKGGAASYLMNYRYSALGLLTDLKVVDTEQKPKYEDLSFKLNFPTKNYGTFSIWGIGGKDSNKEYEETDSTKWEENWDRIQYDYKVTTGAVGFNYKYILGNSTFMNTTLALAGDKTFYDQNRLNDDLVLAGDQYGDLLSGRTSLISDINHKFSARHSNKTGFILSHQFYDLLLKSTIDDDPDTYQTIVDEKGSSQHIQAFSQSQLNLTENFTVNAGIHYEYLALNKNYSFEPRFGINWQVNPRHSLSLGFGKHSQLENLRVYLAKNGDTQPNKNLDFTDAYHFILGYDYRITRDIRLKIEPYFQYLYHVPVDENSSFSFINLYDELYYNEPLVNSGKGRNVGIDLTLEKFLSDNYYYLITASIFQSKYEGGDGIERNSRYARDYVVNALFGKEWHTRKNNMFGLNARLTLMGGDRITPVLKEESLNEKRIILDETKAFEDQMNGSNALDITLTYRINNPMTAHIFALQVKNIFCNKYSYDYKYKTNSIVENKEAVVIPNISYKFEF